MNKALQCFGTGVSQVEKEVKIVPGFKVFKEPESMIPKDLRIQNYLLDPFIFPREIASQGRKQKRRACVTFITITIPSVDMHRLFLSASSLGFLFSLSFLAFHTA